MRDNHTRDVNSCLVLLAYLSIAIVVTATVSCRTSERPGGDAPTPGSASNPPAQGFDAVGSDVRAIELADATMAAMGGREAWDRTRFVTWNFFGRRFHVWDRWTGEIRVESPSLSAEESVVVTVNLETREGRAWVGGAPVTDAEMIEEHLERAYEAWINDSYWVFMPYKLKDTGVTLKYAGEKEMLDGRAAEVVELTFKDVGVTPENRYLVYVAKDSGLVEQWDFYGNTAETEPRFQTPWHEWKPYGEILLSGDRGERGITEIAVYDELPRTVFDSPEPTGLRSETDPASAP